MRRDDVFNTPGMYCWHTVTDEPYRDYDQHCHDEHEIFYLIDGAAERRVESRVYPVIAGSVQLIPPQAFHGIKVVDPAPCHRVSIHFLPEFLDEEARALLPGLFGAGRFHHSCPARLNIDFYVESVLECRDLAEPLRRTALRSRVTALLSQIARVEARDGADGAAADGAAGAAGALLQETLAFINARLTEPFSLERLSRRFRLSKNYLNEMFHQYVGTTVGRYVRIKRVALARKEMRGGMSAKEAAYAVGFNDYSGFYRAYKSFYGRSPTELVVDEVDQALGQNPAAYAAARAAAGP